MTTIWNIQEALVYVVATFYFWKISIHWFWLGFIGLLWQIISVVGLFLMPESPRYLVSAGKLSEAKIAFETIAKWNKKPLLWEQPKYEKSSANFSKSLSESELV